MSCLWSRRFRVYLNLWLRTSNPSYTEQELVNQLEMIKAKVIIAHPTVLKTALSAAQIVGLPAERIVLLNSASQAPHSTLSELVAEGLAKEPGFVERRLAPGEGKTKLAFLSFSSGTTGKPKVRISVLES